MVFTPRTSTLKQTAVSSSSYMRVWLKMCDQIKDNERSHVSINHIYMQPEKSYIRSDEGLTPAQYLRKLPLINLFDKTVFLFSTNAAT